VPSRFYRPELDSLRFAAFLGVFCFHVVPHDPAFYRFLPHAIASFISAAASAGAYGVDLFFALSSYLITTLLLREIEKTGTLDVKAFYVRRVLRIWPLYFFFVGLAIVLSLAHVTDVLEWPYVAGFFLLAGNWVYALKGVPLSVIVIPLWSISIEEQFYLLWPLIVRRVSIAQFKYVLLGFFALDNLARIALVIRHVPGYAAEYNTFARLDPVLWGIALALVLRKFPIRLSLPIRGAMLFASLGTWLTIAHLVNLNAPWAPAPILGTLLGRPLIALAAVGLLAAFIDAPLAVLRNPALISLGKISYGLYVYHEAGLMLARFALHDENAKGHVLRAALGLLITVAVSAASYHWLEMPFLRLKERFTGAYK
jgi:peptidoglycan/LPS O-acetylase OafA/YrhL